MSFKENLLKKIKINTLAQKVINSIGPLGSEKKADKETMRKLLEMSSYEFRQERDMELYILETNLDKKKILVLDNDLGIYHTSIEDVAIRKSPTIKEMLNIKNAIKILNDSDVLVSKKQESVQTIHQECIAVLDLSYEKSDLDEIETDGIASLEREYTDGVCQSLSLFAELLGFVSAPKAFQISSNKVIGGLINKDNNEKCFGPVVIYSMIHNTLKLFDEIISSFDKGKLDFLHQIAAGKQEPSLEGREVFTFLKQAVLNKKYQV